MDEKKAREKMANLSRSLEGLDSLVVAFSGGVDSTFLLTLAHRALGERVLAVTAKADMFPAREQEEALAFVRQAGIPHLLLETGQMNLPEFLANTPDRCYHCKRLLFLALKRIAEQKGMAHVAHGANVEDLDDYRPGSRAAEEIGILGPLVEAGLGKEEIRHLSESMGLPTWDKPSMACLASRIPYGEPVTPEKLRMIERAEAVLSSCGIRQCRVRLHGTVARIEVPTPDMAELAKGRFREILVRKFRQIGFRYVSLDLEGYRSGSMNRTLEGGAFDPR
ncbi:MAG: ATP-dependent sacrificial sulfur transferase LarE [Deltaproteobacteria bacterium]|nr:ATP-dependent sacrificial sulfur transferase LarE [Deltaproteobacteria bacterium]